LSTLNLCDKSYVALSHLQHKLIIIVINYSHKLIVVCFEHSRSSSG